MGLLFGGNYFHLSPGNEGYTDGDDEYEYTMFKRLYKFFGPYPASFQDLIMDHPDIMTLLNHFNDSGPPEKPLKRVTTAEVPLADKEFLLKIMRLDPRERPTAQELLEDEWFTEKSEDTRAPLQ